MPRAYISDETHHRVRSFAEKKNVSISSAYAYLINIQLSDSGDLISGSTDNNINLLEESKLKIFEYINCTQCKWCKAKAHIIENAVVELIQLHKKGIDFIEQLSHTNHINKLEAETHAER